MNIFNKLESNALNFLIGVNVVIFTFTFLIQLLFEQGIDTSAFLLVGGFSTIAIKDGMLWLLMTSNFVHIDLLHFIINMYSLKKVGEIAQYYYGGQKLFVTYILGGIGAAVLTYLATINSSIFSVGASGSVLAIFGLLIGGTVRRSRYGVSLPFELKDFLPTIIILVLYPILLGGRINNWAHLGGAIVGLLLGYMLFSPTIGNIDSEGERKQVSALFKISVLIFAVSFIALMVNFVSEIFVIN